MRRWGNRYQIQTPIPGPSYTLLLPACSVTQIAATQQIEKHWFKAEPSPQAARPDWAASLCYLPAQASLFLGQARERVFLNLSTGTVCTCLSPSLTQRVLGDVSPGLSNQSTPTLPT